MKSGKMITPKTWKEEMVAMVNAVSKDGVNTWISLIENLGVPEVIRAEWVETYIGEVKNLMHEMQKDLEERQKNMQRVIVELKKKIADATYALGIEATLPVVSNMYQEEVKLNEYYRILQDQVTQKHEEIQQLVDRQDKICGMLGKPRKLLNVQPLPNNTELQDFVAYIEALEDEVFIREEKYTRTQFDLKQLAEEIDYEPVGEFEEQILQHTDCPFEVNDKNMFLLNTFYCSLNQHAENIKNEVEVFIVKIKQLWQILETDEQYCNVFLENHQGYKLSTINALNYEIKRLEDLKKANVGMLIKRSQLNLIRLWDKCHYSEAQRRRFDTQDANIYTESMLTTLQNEVRKLSIRYDENKNLIESLEKFAETCRRVKELETPEEGQDRYRNRGGRLLIEEKERKIAKKRLDKLEQAILQMNDDFFRRTGEHFTFEGIAVEEYIQNYQDMKEERSRFTSKTTLMSAHSSMNGFASTTRILKAANSNNHYSPSRRRLPLGSKQDVTAHKSSYSGLSRSAPPIRENPIRTRRRKMKASAQVPNFKVRANLILKAVEQKDETITVENYSSIKGLSDTSMPSLLRNSLAMNSTVVEKNRRLALTETPRSSFEDDTKENEEATTPKSNFKNITYRRTGRKNQ